MPDTRRLFKPAVLEVDASRHCQCYVHVLSLRWPVYLTDIPGVERHRMRQISVGFVVIIPLYALD